MPKRIDEMTWLDWLTVKFEKLAKAAEADLHDAILENADAETVAMWSQRAASYHFVLKDLRQAAEEYANARTQKSP